MMPKFKSSQPTTETPNINNIYNQQPSRAGYVLAWAFVIAIGILLLYYWTVSVLDSLGFNAEKFILNILFWPFFAAGWILFLSRVWNYIEDGRHARRLELERLRLERLALQHKLQSSVSVDSREADPQTKRRNALIVALVADALGGQHNFSYRKAGEYILTDETKPVGKDSRAVRDALAWLRDNGLVVNNQLTDSATLSEVQRSLFLPIVAHPRLSSSSYGTDDT